MGIFPIYSCTHLLVLYNHFLKSTLSRRYNIDKIFCKILSCLSKDASTLRAPGLDKSVHPLDAHASDFTPADRQTIEQRQKENDLDINTLLSILLTCYPNGRPTVPKLEKSKDCGARAGPTRAREGRKITRSVTVWSHPKSIPDVILRNRNSCSLQCA